MSVIGHMANKEIYHFLRTVTIKNSYFAERSRTLQIKPSIVDRVALRETPYYRHVAGEYILKGALTANITNPTTGELESWSYSSKTPVLRMSEAPDSEMENRYVYNDSAFDEMMYITSLDTGETIPFVLELLHPEYAEDVSRVHTKTLEAYQLPSRYFELLCDQYPKQVDLIKAIVYPVKLARDLTPDEIYKRDYTGLQPPSLMTRRKDYLVDAANFEILRYDDSVLDENERHNLVGEMQAIVRMINERWFIKEYNIEENYNAVLWTVMWSVLTLGLVAQRYVNIKTPFAHSSHIWDYLISKGLQSYQGYLNTEQTLFLYKNIDYILQHRGKQFATNLLIDNILNNVGLNIKSKTVVLDTSKCLDESERHVSIDPSSQCAKCTKRSWCRKNLKDYVCPDRQAIDDLCKAEPVILTEEFAGASKEKVINRLMSQYGYTRTEAEEKYARGTLWANDEIEAIKDALNKDQLVDLNGSVESLDTLIRNEHNSGLEPVYNSDVVAKQFNDLRHINGTYAPTKILEIMKKNANPRFMKLFSKFLTETLLHFCPRVVDHKTLTKVKTAYTINVQKDSTCVFNFNELMASLYLGLCREFDIEVVHDYITPVDYDDDDNKTYMAGVTYFQYLDERHPAASPTTYVNPNRLFMLIEGEDYQVGDRIYNRAGQSYVYMWAPSVPGMFDRLPMIYGHELLTNVLKSPTFDFPVPRYVRMTTAIKFGKPVKQKELVKLWMTDTGEYDKYINYFPNHVTKVLKISDIYYGVRESNDLFPVEDETIWENQPVRLVIVGAYKNGNYYPNHGEIPIVPQYFRWHYAHLHPQAEEGVFAERICTYIPDGGFKEDGSAPDTDTINIKSDMHLSEQYMLLELDRFLDVDTLVDSYMDLLEDVTDASVIGTYLDNQFTLLERLYCTASEMLSIKTSLAASEFLRAITLNDKQWEVDLTGVQPRTEWPSSSVPNYPIDPVTCVTYNDWFKLSQEIGSAFRTVDKSPDAKTIWNTFNTNAITALAGGCSLAYLSSAIDNTVIDKLRELVTHLSSYKVAIISSTGTERSCDSIVPIVSDYITADVGDVSYEYIMPILDATWSPRAGGFASLEPVYLKTHDTVAKEGKYYYEPKMSTRLAPFPLDSITLDSDALEFIRITGLHTGDKLPTDKDVFELVDLFGEAGISKSSDAVRYEFDGKGNWSYRIGTKVDVALEVPASEADNELDGEFDEFISASYISPEIRRLCKAIKYRKYLSVHDYEWSDPVKSDVLGYWLNPMVKPYTVTSLDKDNICVTRIVELDNQIEVQPPIIDNSEE